MFSFHSRYCYKFGGGLSRRGRDGCLHICKRLNQDERYTAQTIDRGLNIKPFKVIGEEAKIDTSSEMFARNKSHWEKTVESYRKCVDMSVSGADKKSRDRHVKYHGKLLVYDKVKALVDNMDDFLELSLIAGIDMEYGHVPRGGILTGIGKVVGRYCLITANDGAFKGGAIFPVTLKKQLRAHEIAQQNQLPCIYIVDSAGAFLPLQAEIFNPGGQIFYNEAIMSAAQIPQIAIVCGSCTAGGAYVPTMADESIIVDKTGTIFLGGPPLVQAALGEIISAEELGGAVTHCKISGCSDYFAESEAEAFHIGRDIVASLNISCNSDLGIGEFDSPLYDIEEVYGILPSPGTVQSINMYQVIARLVDGSRFHEFKALYGRHLLTGFAHIQGDMYMWAFLYSESHYTSANRDYHSKPQTVCDNTGIALMCHSHLTGFIASQGQINETEATKGVHFVQLCCERDVPLVFLQNTDSDEDSVLGSKEYAVTASLALKCRARMLAAVSCASVPKLTVIIGSGFGSSHYIMGGRAVSPNFLFAWPNAQVSIMEPSKLAKIIAQQKKSTDLNSFSAKYQKYSSAIYGATRLLNDGILLPEDTRKVLSQCLDICQAYRLRQKPAYPVLRM